MATLCTRTFGGTEGSKATGSVQGPEPIKNDLTNALNSLNPSGTMVDGTSGGVAAQNCQTSFLNTLVGTNTANKTPIVGGGVTGTINNVSFNSSGNITLAGSTGITVSQDSSTNTVTITATGGVAPASHASTHIQGGADPLSGTIAVNVAGNVTGNVVGNATTATTATNIAGGSVGQILYQSAAGITGMLTTGTSGQLLQSNGAAAPSWVTNQTNSWASSKAYTVGQICYLSASPYIQLECVASGTSGSTEPTSFTVGLNLTDGTATWRVRDTRNISPAMSFSKVIITNTPTTITLASGALIGLRNSAGTRVINILTSSDITLTPTLAASTAYYLWLVHTTSTNTTTLVMTTTTTAPSYDYYRYLGGRFTDSSSRLYIINQSGKECNYIVDGTVLTGSRIIASGIVGNIATPTWYAVAVNDFVPTTSTHIILALNHNGGSGTLMVAPSNLYGVYNSASNPPFEIINAVYNLVEKFTMPLLSSNIYYASSASTNYLLCYGWIENV